MLGSTTTALIAAAGVVACSGAAPASGPAPAGPACHTAWPMPNPPSSGLPSPQSYDASAPGVVVDRVTGLVWQRTIDPIGHNWNDAHTYCADLGVAGYRDWRLPSVLELVSIADVSRANPAIDPTAFPDTPSLPFWSSETDASNSGLGWYVYFLNGGAYNGNDVVDPQRVRCVRGGAPSAGGDAGCYAMNDGTVLDPNTHLTWQRALDPASFAWTDAQAYCASVAANGGGFRLPSMNELMTLVDVTRMDPAIDTAVFPETPSDFFWSSSPGANSAQTAWGVNFNKGSAATSLVDFTSRVRCLR